MELHDWNDWPERDKAALGERLTDLRKNRNLSINQLSKELNVNKDTISLYETGKRLMPSGTVQKYSEFFNVTTDYLLGISDNQNYINADIGERTGLTDNSLKALDILKYKADSNSPTYKQMLEVINILLPNWSSVLVLITKYMMFNPNDKVMEKMEVVCDYKNKKIITAPPMPDDEAKMDDYVTELYKTISPSEDAFFLVDAKSMLEKVMKEEILKSIEEIRHKYWDEQNNQNDKKRTREEV